MGRFITVRVGLFLVTLLVLLSGCGKESSSTAQKQTPAGGISREAQGSNIENCLADAGLEVETTDVPKLSGVTAIGVRSSTGGGEILPGDLEAAVYVYGSESEAKQAHNSILFSPESRLSENVVIQFAPKPSSGFRESVVTCVHAARDDT